VSAGVHARLVPGRTTAPGQGCRARHARGRVTQSDYLHGPLERETVARLVRGREAACDHRAILAGRYGDVQLVSLPLVPYAGPPAMRRAIAGTRGQRRTRLRDIIGRERI